LKSAIKKINGTLKFRRNVAFIFQFWHKHYTAKLHVAIVAETWRKGRDTVPAVGQNRNIKYC